MTKYCGVLFRCGCTWSFAGGASKCNIHNPDGTDIPQYVQIMNSRHLLLALRYTTDRVLILLTNFLTGPHCPWCAAEFPATIAVAPLAKTTLIVTYFLFEWFKWPHYRRMWLKLVICVASFFVYGFFSALIFKLATGYPYFLIE